MMQLPPHREPTVRWVVCCEHGVATEHSTLETAQADADRRNHDGGREDCKPWGVVKRTTQVAYEAVR